VPGQSSFASQSPVVAQKPAPDTQDTPETRHRRIGLNLIGLGGVAVAVGVAFYLISGEQAASLRSSCNATPQSADCATMFDDSVSKVHLYDRIAAASWVTGAALVVGGVALQFRSAGEHLERSSRANLGFDPLRRAVTLEGRF
jgi:hypothetical protein